MLKTLLKKLGIRRMSGGIYLFIISTIYLIFGIVDIFVYKFMPAEAIQVIYVLVLSLPIWIPPLARKINMKPLF